MACPKCKINPFSHSFVPFGKNSRDETLYYTGIARMTSLDDYINLQCWTLHMDSIKGPWVWIIDCANMEIHHNITPQFSTVFANILMLEHSRSLKRIVVLYPNRWMYGIIHTLFNHIPTYMLESILFVRSDIDFNQMRISLGIGKDAIQWLLLARTVEPNRMLSEPLLTNI